ncbi:MAG: recombinase family protein [Candidatus Dormibacteria bacterium]
MKHDEWTRESEAAALARLTERSAEGATALVLVYTRQSQSDFDQAGNPMGPSLDQQLDAVTRRAELQGLRFEHYQDADRSGKETSRRPGYLAMIERIGSAGDGTIGAVAFYDSDRLHRMWAA